MASDLTASAVGAIVAEGDGQEAGCLGSASLLAAADAFSVPVDAYAGLTDTRRASLAQRLADTGYGR